MAVDLNKMNADAPHLVRLYKHAQSVFLNKGLDPEVYRSAVTAAFDLSGSVQEWPNCLYSDGTMQSVGDLALASGFAFDDDGSVPVAFFHHSIVDIGEATPATSRGFLNVWENYSIGGTSYIAAIKWMLGKAGFSISDGEIEAWARALKTENFSGITPLSVKGVSRYPTYGLLATDGEPQDDHWELLATIYLASQYPLYIQCLGVGAKERFETLEEFDDLPTQVNGALFGRLIANVGAFDTKLANGDQKRMLEMMLREYPTYYNNARILGLITV